MKQLSCGCNAHPVFLWMRVRHGRREGFLVMRVGGRVEALFNGGQRQVEGETEGGRGGDMKRIKEVRWGRVSRSNGFRL